MPDDICPATNPYRHMTLTEVMTAHEELLARWQREDAERAARRAAILSGMEGR